jgi:two-component system response regulator DesR
VTVRVLIAEDQAMVRGALSALLSLEEDIDVVAEASRGDEVVSAALDAFPDVALLDIEMPGSVGLSAAAALKERLPACRVTILTTFGRAGYLRRAMDSGAVGFMLKDAPSSKLASAIRRAMGGERVMDPGLAAALSVGHNPLTERERDVLSASANGATVADVAAELYLSEGTVRNCLSTAIKKLRARNCVEAARLAERMGWL